MLNNSKLMFFVTVCGMLLMFLVVFAQGQSPPTKPIPVDPEPEGAKAAPKGFFPDDDWDYSSQYYMYSKQTLLHDKYVGIGTTTPQTYFHVNGYASNGLVTFGYGGGASFTGESAVKVGTAANTRNGISIRTSNNNASDFEHASLWIDNVGQGGLVFFAGDEANDASPFVIDHEGKVGVGTRYPSARLHVYDPEFPGIIITDGVVGGLELAVATVNGNYSNIATAGDAVIRTPGGASEDVIITTRNDNDSAIRFATGNTSYGPNGESEKMTIIANGNVGIGTTNPQGKLDVNGEIWQRGALLHADYVFDKNYELESIEEHAQFMWNNKHLEAIPKARVDDAGLEIVAVGSHRKGIVEELEKAHIYIEQLHKHIQMLDKQMESITEKIARLEGENSTGC